MNPVLTYYANIVDYFRLGMILLAFVFSTTHPALFLVFYILGAALDMADGHLARKYDQCSNFGAVFDMILDRAALAMLMVVLGSRLPRAAPLFALAELVDLCAHWTATVTAAHTRHHHKKCASAVLNFYYRPLVLASVCGANELCWLSLYMSTFESLGALCRISKYLFAAALPLALFKLVVAVIQWCECGVQLADYDLEQRKHKTN